MNLDDIDDPEAALMRRLEREGQEASASSAGEEEDDRNVGDNGDQQQEGEAAEDQVEGENVSHIVHVTPASFFPSLESYEFFGIRSQEQLSKLVRLFIQSFALREVFYNKNVSHLFVLLCREFFLKSLIVLFVI
ncbi:hypothetical protein R1sor_018691 [Riccia sorocarpa]|uniref:Uncharacterized protein n=1 Tax=Riccia sorocarpa TaxID=122646 RepID=A0ABD3IGM1_9MARC